MAQRRKLLRLYYDDKIGADLFAEEEARLSVAIREAKRETEAAQAEVARSDDVARPLRRRGSAARRARHRQDVDGRDRASSGASSSTSSSRK